MPMRRAFFVVERSGLLVAKRPRLLAIERPRVGMLQSLDIELRERERMNEGGVEAGDLRDWS